MVYVSNTKINKKPKPTSINYFACTLDRVMGNWSIFVVGDKSRSKFLQLWITLSWSLIIAKYCPFSRPFTCFDYIITFIQLIHSTTFEQLVLKDIVEDFRHFSLKSKFTQKYFLNHSGINTIWQLIKFSP